MGISQVLLVCVLWCFLNQAHSIPSHVNQGLSSFRSSVGTLRHRRAHSDVCGISKKTEVNKLSIMNGKDAILGDWPWMVAFFEGQPSDEDPDFYCGGSLISDQWVITAAHCVIDLRTGEVRNASMIFVRLADLDISDPIKDGTIPLDALVDKLVPHPQFQLTPGSNDIALARLKNPVHFTESVRPICLLSGAEYRTNEFYEGEKSFVIGWGLLIRYGSISTRLQEASADIVSYDICSNYSEITSRYLVDEKVICAGGTETSVCKGDSGGPLMLLNEDDNRFYLAGITSWGVRGACNLKFPQLFCKVAPYVCWISDITGIDF